MMKTIDTKLPWFAVAALALLAGCAAPYVPAKDEKMASVAVVGGGSLTLCRNGQRHPLWPTQGIVQVPVGSPVEIASRMQSDGGNVIWTCASAVAFTPDPDRAYIVNDGFIDANRCFVELVQQAPGAVTGVALETSARKGSCR